MYVYNTQSNVSNSKNWEANVNNNFPLQNKCDRFLINVKWYKLSYE